MSWQNLINTIKQELIVIRSAISIANKKIHNLERITLPTEKVKEIAKQEFESYKPNDGYTPIKGKDYFDGKDAYTPQKGFDYWTKEDKKNIQQEVIKHVLKQVPEPQIVKKITKKYITKGVTESDLLTLRQQLLNIIKRYTELDIDDLIDLLNEYDGKKKIDAKILKNLPGGKSVSYITNNLTYQNKVLNVTDDYTLLGNETSGEFTIIADTSSNDITITLPSESKLKNKYVNITKKSEFNTVTIAGTVSGKTNYKLQYKYSSFRFTSDGNNYYIQ